MLKITELGFGMPSRPVLSAIDFTLEQGKVYGLLGPNGAGKSTLLKLLCRELTPATGKIELDGIALNLWSRQELACRLGVLPQHAKLDFPFQVAEVVAMGAFPLSLSSQAIAAEVSHCLAQVGLNGFEERDYGKLSGGERQRVQLARVLLQLSQTDRGILLLDEPTSALDLAHQHRVLQLARNLARERNFIVVAVLHCLNLAAEYCDGIHILDNGRLKLSGGPKACLTPEQINAVWHYQPSRFVADDGRTLLF
ncbi:heme ABC transporter ATP-binding protein [Shewanella sp. JM162201]|uniref:Heme ABC transporter ATP-binding protein n=1 Tax=Shewanella jiangmenensis TaxID=2837387 RepID=A0ABS5UZT4_9GAMM|nr:heme ABC transporter ATP-binding protein [Shewanella jiangmenensis]MBT1443714.1 heme ABC transporter ATP-binding protein [Shewanella jiangmenensis]